MDAKRRPPRYYQEAKKEDFVVVHDETNPRVAHDNYVEEDIVGLNGVVEYADVLKASQKLRQICELPMDSNPRKVVRAGKSFDRFAAARASLDEALREDLGTRPPAEREQRIHNARKEWQDARAVLRWAIFCLTSPEEAADVEDRSYARDVWNQPWEELNTDSDAQETIPDPYTGSGPKATGYGPMLLSYMFLAGGLVYELTVRDIKRQLGYS
ncbi:hypothetical protein HYFRA_00003181 [Hymenoscyphus fraxineus]|uniref:Uncharacterized protein n=1 Tax=Hymenoscyphus fraxineus TaxID=746836 RepID=A0A9N9KSY3_9HELO|nr:hypothetical protein HYFRA_00003181 [Hymenoscyphus fraxineus]